MESESVFFSKFLISPCTMSTVPILTAPMHTMALVNVEKKQKALKRKLIPDVCQCYQDQPDFL